MYNTMTILPTPPKPPLWLRWPSCIRDPWKRPGAQRVKVSSAQVLERASRGVAWNGCWGLAHGQWHGVILLKVLDLNTELAAAYRRLILKLSQDQTRKSIFYLSNWPLSNLMKVSALHWGKVERPSTAALPLGRGCTTAHLKREIQHILISLFPPEVGTALF